MKGSKPWKYNAFLFSKAADSRIDSNKTKWHHLLGLVSKTTHRRQVMPRREISMDERETLARGLARGLTCAQLARALGRTHSVVSREIQRNQAADGVYRAHEAEARAVARRQHAGRPSKFRQRWLRRRVQYGLRVQRWSPEQIAGYLQVAYPPTNRSGGSRTKRSINFWWRRRRRAGITGVMCDAWVGGAATVNAARTSVFATRGVLTNAPRSWRPNAGWATGKLTACAGHSRATPGWPSLQNAKPSMWWWRK